jgi:hypothetical protein
MTPTIEHVKKAIISSALYTAHNELTLDEKDMVRKLLKKHPVYANQLHSIKTSKRIKVPFIDVDIFNDIDVKNMKNKDVFEKLETLDTEEKLIQAFKMFVDFDKPIIPVKFVIAKPKKSDRFKKLMRAVVRLTKDKDLLHIPNFAGKTNREVKQFIKDEFNPNSELIMKLFLNHFNYLIDCCMKKFRKGTKIYDNATNKKLIMTFINKSLNDIGEICLRAADSQLKFCLKAIEINFGMGSDHYKGIRKEYNQFRHDIKVPVAKIKYRLKDLILNSKTMEVEELYDHLARISDIITKENSLSAIDGLIFTVNTKIVDDPAVKTEQNKQSADYTDMKTEADPLTVKLSTKLNDVSSNQEKFISDVIKEFTVTIHSKHSKLMEDSSTTKKQIIDMLELEIVSLKGLINAHTYHNVNDMYEFIASDEKYTTPLNSSKITDSADSWLEQARLVTNQLFETLSSFRSNARVSKHNIVDKLLAIPEDEYVIENLLYKELAKEKPDTSVAATDTDESDNHDTKIIEKVKNSKKDKDKKKK